MPDPSKNYTLIPDSNIDADSPLDTTLMTQIRDNLIHLEEWIGDGYTAAKNHNHDGVNSAGATVADSAITEYKLGYIVGDIALSAADNAGNTTSTTYVKKKEIQLGKGGAFRIKFDIHSNGAGNTAYAKIYRNGVPVGTERIVVNSLVYQTFSEDISGWLPGDLCQLYVHSNSASFYAYCRNFRTYYGLLTDTVTMN